LQLPSTHPAKGCHQAAITAETFLLLVTSEIAALDSRFAAFLCPVKNDSLKKKYKKKRKKPPYFPNRFITLKLSLFRKWFYPISF